MQIITIIFHEFLKQLFWGVKKDSGADILLWILWNARPDPPPSAGSRKEGMQHGL